VRYDGGMPSHLSYSQIALYLECPLKYQLVYLEGLEREGIPSALAFGRVIHKALAGFYRDAMDREPFNLAAFLKAFAEAWENETDEKGVIYREGEDFETLLELGKAMLRAFARTVRPQRVIGVELPFEFRLEHPFTGKDTSVPIRGVIDLVEEDEAGTLWVVDHNRDKLCRTPDGRYRAGVFVVEDPAGRFRAQVLVARKGVGPGEIIALPAQRLPPQATFEDAVGAARAWALEHLPQIYECAPDDVSLELLQDAPEFT